MAENILWKYINFLFFVCITSRFSINSVETNDMFSEFLKLQQQQQTHFHNTIVLHIFVAAIRKLSANRLMLCIKL